MLSRTSHQERTAAEPRQAGLHQVKLSSIKAINSRIRLLTLTVPYTIQFLPGQWLDVWVPGIAKAGGFTITSSPSRARMSSRNANATPHLELAIQHSPANPPAAWLWQPQDKILGSVLQVRVGGNFTWPPPNINVNGNSNGSGNPKVLDELLLIAGGVGINPLISILAFLREQRSARGQHVPKRLTLLYASKLDATGLQGVLFYPRIHQLWSNLDSPGWKCRMFLSGQLAAKSELDQDTAEANKNINIEHRRLSEDDVLQSLPPTDGRSRLAAYICGPAQMTDHFVNYLRKIPGVEPEHVFCEKWW